MRRCHWACQQHLWWLCHHRSRGRWFVGPFCCFCLCFFRVKVPSERGEVYDGIALTQVLCCATGTNVWVVFVLLYE
ncbi:hypothetical protein V8C37DRAFT_374095 [Trichoderma ceciliae]